MNNKSLITNLLAAALTLIGLITGITLIQMMGFVALSGALTNWAAVYMLFERVPFVYGSGIIPNRFEDFKHSIKKLILEQFFSQDNIDDFLSRKMAASSIDMQGIAESIDYDRLFDSFVDTIMDSDFGSMINTFLGGREGLMPLRESFAEKLYAALQKMLDDEQVRSKVQQSISAGMREQLHQEIEPLIDTRLEALTPRMVKEIIQHMIRTHLGWLVVWGGVFGALFGLLATLVT